MKKFIPKGDKLIVFNLLTEIPESRDNKEMLYNAYVSKKGYNPMNMSVDCLLELIRNHRLRCPSTIYRYSRGIQKLFPELRGKEYDKRRGVVQDAVKKDLGYGMNETPRTMQKCAKIGTQVWGEVKEEITPTKALCIKDYTSFFRGQVFTKDNTYKLRKMKDRDVYLIRDNYNNERKFADTTKYFIIS